MKLFPYGNLFLFYENIFFYSWFSSLVNNALFLSHSFQNVSSCLPSSPLTYQHGWEDSGNVNAWDLSEPFDHLARLRGKGCHGLAGGKGWFKTTLKKILKQRQAFSELLREREIPRKEKGTSLYLARRANGKIQCQPGHIYVSLSD